MTRVVVDRERCMCAGVCGIEALEVFERDADVVLRVRRPADVSTVETAVQACPTGGLELVD
jgi:ferredoxin